MSEMPANYLDPNAVENYHRPPNRMRSQQEITAKYNQDLEIYKQLCFSSQDMRQQKLTTYTEIKALGWVLGKPEKTVIKDISDHSNKMTFGTF